MKMSSGKRNNFQKPTRNRIIKVYWQSIKDNNSKFQKLKTRFLRKIQCLLFSQYSNIIKNCSFIFFNKTKLNNERGEQINPYSSLSQNKRLAIFCKITARGVAKQVNKIAYCCIVWSTSIWKLIVTAARSAI